MSLEKTQQTYEIFYLSISNAGLPVCHPIQEDANIDYDDSRSISTRNSGTTNLTTPPIATNDRRELNQDSIGQSILCDYYVLFFSFFID